MYRRIRLSIFVIPSHEPNTNSPTGYRSIGPQARGLNLYPHLTVRFPSRRKARRRGDDDGGSAGPAAEWTLTDGITAVCRYTGGTERRRLRAPYYCSPACNQFYGHLPLCVHVYAGQQIASSCLHLLLLLLLPASTPPNAYEKADLSLVAKLL